MPPEKGDAAYLWDMLDAARAIRDFTAGRTFHDYLGDRMQRRAVERSVVNRTPWKTKNRGNLI